jgi:ankyrin repeat protein
MEDEKGLLAYLKQQIKPLEIMPMQCQRKFTCLAYSAYRNNTDCFKILFEYAAKYENYFSLLNKDCTLQFWANMRTGDSFTALHFAARHGNYTMLELLCERAGVDKMIMNKFGSTPIHIAA